MTHTLREVHRPGLSEWAQGTSGVGGASLSTSSCAWAPGGDTAAEGEVLPVRISQHGPPSSADPWPTLEVGSAIAPSLQVRKLSSYETWQRPG